MIKDFSIFVFIVSLIVGGLLFFTGVLEPTMEQSQAKREAEFVSRCDAKIKSILKAPSTAVIKYYGFSSGAIKGSEYSVLARVDAANGFGSMIRNTMECKSICAVNGDYMSCGRIKIEH